MRTHARTVPSRGLNFEYLTWVFTRLSGAALALFVLFGGAAALAMQARTLIDMPTLIRWSFFPNLYHVVNYLPDTTTWEGAFWQIMGILVAVFGLTHGLNGLRVVVEDYLGPSILRLLLRFILFVFWGFMLGVAVFIIFRA
jgi:succinate dehydrogenase hydrophobic anchor subunit